MFLFIKKNSDNTVEFLSQDKIFLFKTIIIYFKNKLSKPHSINDTFYLAYPVYRSINQIVKHDPFLYNLKIKTNSYNTSYFQKGDVIILDYGNKRKLEITDSSHPPYYINNNFREVPTTSFHRIENVINNDDSITIQIKNIKLYYPSNTSILLLKNILVESDTKEFFDDLPYNNLSTQPFIFEDEWYTKIFYNTCDYRSGFHQNSQGKIKHIFNGLSDNLFDPSYYNTYRKTEIFIHSMKGIKIPFLSLDLDSNDSFINNYSTDLYLEPTSNDTYDTNYPGILPFSQNKLINQNLGFNGKFFRDFYSENSKSSLIWTFLDNTNSIKGYNHNFNYFIVKGLFFGFGGILEERFSKSYINNILNNDHTLRIARIKEINNKYFVFADIDTIKSPLVFDKTPEFFKSKINQAGRSKNLPYDIFLNIIENNLTESESSNIEYQNRLISYGYGGKICKKIIEYPYNLNPNNYLYLVIPKFNNISLVQNNKVNGAFAKILLPGESNRIIYNSYMGASKNFTDYLYNNLSELEIAFVTNDGYLFDFNGAEHSIIIELTTIIDKFEYINPRFGNIEF